MAYSPEYGKRRMYIKVGGYIDIPAIDSISACRLWPADYSLTPWPATAAADVASPLGLPARMQLGPEA